MTAVYLFLAAGLVFLWYSGIAHLLYDQWGWIWQKKELQRIGGASLNNVSASTWAMAKTQFIRTRRHQRRPNAPTSGYHMMPEQPPPIRQVSQPIAQPVVEPVVVIEAAKERRIELAL